MKTGRSYQEDFSASVTCARLNTTSKTWAPPAYAKRSDSAMLKNIIRPLPSPSPGSCERTHKYWTQVWRWRENVKEGRMKRREEQGVNSASSWAAKQTRSVISMRRSRPNIWALFTPSDRSLTATLPEPLSLFIHSFFFFFFILTTCCRPPD